MFSELVLVLSQYYDGTNSTITIIVLVLQRRVLTFLSRKSRFLKNNGLGLTTDHMIAIVARQYSRLASAQAPSTIIVASSQWQLVVRQCQYQCHSSQNIIHDITAWCYHSVLKELKEIFPGPVIRFQFISTIKLIIHTGGITSR